MNIRAVLINKSTNALMCKLVEKRSTRRSPFGQIEWRLYRESMTWRPGQCPTQAKLDRMAIVSGLLNGLDRVISRGIVSKSVLRHILSSTAGQRDHERRRKTHRARGETSIRPRSW